MTTDAVGRRQPPMSKNFGDGGPAFPVWELNGHGQPEMTGFGMSLRDWFAGQALAGELASYAGSCSDPANYAGDIAARCYKLADAMLKAREASNAAAAGEESSKGADVARPKRRRYDPYGSLSEYGIFPECDAQHPADDEVVFIDGVGAGRSSIKSCRNGVQWIMVGDRVYWPLSDSDAKRLQSACCGNGSFDGPATPAVEGEQQ